MRWLLLVLVACGSPSRGDDDQVTPDAAPQGSGTADICYAPSEQGMVTPGASTVQDCAIWNSLDEMKNQVLVTRNLTSLSMMFDSPVLFAGTVTDGSVDLTYTHLHDFEDGCKWRATEKLVGTLDEGTCKLSLTYTYREMVEDMQGEPSCATPCAADGSFALDITPIIE
ncbi:MAG: hypothetical protein QM831_20860 [Kofleriaceae bacterium]